MKVRLLESIVGNDPNGGPSFSYGKGVEVEMPDSRAMSLVRSGLAVAIEAPKQERAIAAAPAKEIRRK